MMKYTDDNYLLVGSNYIQTVADEFAGVMAWPTSNNLKINHNKQWRRQDFVMGGFCKISQIVTTHPSDFCEKILFCSPNFYDFFLVMSKISNDNDFFF